MALQYIKETQENNEVEESDAFSSIGLESSEGSIELNLHLMSVYQPNDNNTSVSISNGVTSRKLLIYNAVIGEEAGKRVVIDSAASTVYLNEGIAEKLGASVTKIKPRKVNVTGKNVVMVNGIVSFEMKLGDLPKKTVTAYTIPLGTGINLILGLPWLKKYNSRVDWQLCSFEFNKNRQHHMLWPARPTPNIRIASPEEFMEFMEELASLFIIH